MGIEQLDNLVRIGSLKEQAPSEKEIRSLIAMGRRKLADAERPGLSLDSRFDLAYNAAHAFSLAALRAHGYRSENRYVVFQALVHTIDLPHAQWRVLEDAHRRRNFVEYEGVIDISKAVVAGVVRVAHIVEGKLAQKFA